MNYGYIIHQVLDNIGADRHDSNRITSIKHDIQKVTRDLFTDAVAPIKSESFSLTEYADDSIATTIPDLAVASPSYTYAEKIKSMNGLSIVAKNAGVPPIVGTSNLNVTITSSAGTELLNHDISLVDDVELITDIEVLVNDIVGAVLVITGSAFISSTINVSSVSWEKSFNSLELPEYMYMPIDAEFKVSANSKAAAYISREATEEEYNRWNPWGAGREDSDEPYEVLEWNWTPHSSMYTIENLMFDGRIGYFFTAVDDKVYIHFKPAVTGTITVRFSYLPTIDPEPENSVPVHTAFINGLIDGTTVKQFEKKINDAETELDLMKIRSSISRYETPYKECVKRFTGYNRKKTEVHQIKMFGIADDMTMELIGTTSNWY